MNFSDRALEKGEYQLPDVFIEHITKQVLANKRMSNEEGYKRLVNAIKEGKVSGAWLKRVKNLYETNELFMELMGVEGKNWVESKLQSLRNSRGAMKGLKRDLGLNPIQTRDRSGLGKVNERVLIITESMAEMIGKSGYINEQNYHDIVFYHGGPNKHLSGKNGIHIGTKLAATQALESRIGVPAEGEWNGTREYGKTLIAGKRRLSEIEKERGYYVRTGYNAGSDIPDENYYPSDRAYKASFSDKTQVPLNSRPIVFPVKITGKMTNATYSPHSDQKANSMILRNMRMGNAKSGYFYKNDGEDEGSISAVVPDASFLRIL